VYHSGVKGMEAPSETSQPTAQPELGGSFEASGTCLDMSTMQKNRLLRMPKNVQPPIRRILNQVTRAPDYEAGGAQVLSSTATDTARCRW
jgi:hypothetical protein